MTELEAKELLIGGINYGAYKETDHSLWPSDMNELFGRSHYPEDRPVFAPSVWGQGEEFEQHMVKLLKWAVELGTSKGDYAAAIEIMRASDGCLGRVIRKSGL
jgi:hypothetical protein